MKISEKNPRLARVKRHLRLRSKVKGTADRPRLGVFRSLTHISAQIIDDDKGHTLVSASSLEKEMKDKGPMKKQACAEQVGAILAQRALAKGLKLVVFDRGGYKYHGRVAALAAAARKAGLQF